MLGLINKQPGGFVLSLSRCMVGEMAPGYFESKHRIAIRRDNDQLQEFQAVPTEDCLADLFSFSFYCLQRIDK